MGKLYFSLLALLLFLSTRNAQATHFLGGEMSYKYLGANKYELTVRMYVDCHHGEPNAIAQDAPLYLSAFESGKRLFTDSIGIYKTGSIQPGPLSSCYQDTNHVCVNWVEFRKTYTLPASSNNYMFVCQRCCMTADGSNTVDPGGNGVTLYATIPGGSTALSNSGPAFNALPPARICMNEQFSIDFGSADPDGDSLSYHLETGYKAGTATDAKPYGNLPLAPLTYAYGYSFQQPLGPTGALNLDQNTGTINGYCSVPGEYLICVVCESYKNGSWTGRSVRQYVLTVQDCNKSVKALVQIDSLSYLIGDGTGISVCGSNRTATFTNLSTNASSYHWDFGVAGQNDDTSTGFEPTFTYPATGSYLLTLIARNGACTDTFQTMVRVADNVISPDFSISGGPCMLDTLSLTNTSTSIGSPITKSIWFVGPDNYSGSPANAYIRQSGTFDISLITANDSGCIAETSKPFTAIRGAIKASNDTTVVRRTALVISASGGGSYSWTAVPPAMFAVINPTSATQQPYTFYPGAHFMFVVSGKDGDGCGGMDTVLVTVTESGYVFVPSGFTPNGDGRNDYLKARLSGQIFQSMSIYNRQGDEVFHSDNLQPGWDGRYKGSEAPAGTYFWMVRTKNAQGNTEISKGDVTLVR